MPDEVTWTVSDGSGNPQPPKIPYVPMWRTFSKASEEDKERIFNSMRQIMIDKGLMESR